MASAASSRFSVSATTMTFGTDSTPEDQFRVHDNYVGVERSYGGGRIGDGVRAMNVVLA
jgi:hypothetical protein